MLDAPAGKHPVAHRQMDPVPSWLVMRAGKPVVGAVVGADLSRRPTSSLSVAVARKGRVRSCCCCRLLSVSHGVLCNNKVTETATVELASDAIWGSTIHFGGGFDFFAIIVWPSYRQQNSLS